MVCADVRAIDINMGCPVKFSVQAAWAPRCSASPSVKDILGTLVRNPVCGHVQIRLLDSAHDTLQLARAIRERASRRSRCTAAARPAAGGRGGTGSRCSAGSSAPSCAAANGDIFLPEHVRGAREATSCTRSCSRAPPCGTASLFGAPEAELRPQREVVARSWRSAGGTTTTWAQG